MGSFGAFVAGSAALIDHLVHGAFLAVVVDGHLHPVLPLVVPDPYFTFTLSNPNTPPLGSSFGTLTATGQAIASFFVPAGSSPTFAGVSLSHAYVVFDTTSTPGSPIVDFASNPVELTLIP